MRQVKELLITSIYTGSYKEIVNSFMAKSNKKQALGRGLSALLKDPENDIKSVDDKNADKVVGNIIELEIDAIEINPFQPRSFKESLRELGVSIKELGVIQPLQFEN
jgi:ParB family chromosome partitioning protein